MKIKGDWLQHPGTQAVFQRLSDFDSFAVGGCVRNDLLGAQVSDIDIATSATPLQMQKVCADLKVIPTGIEHGTLTVISHGIPHEITTFRKDVETDGRHAHVVFGGDVAADAARRDFTMNALYADAAGTIVDPLGGLPDLINRHVRFIGTPEARITEDYLRILRFFRFTAWYGDDLDPDGLAACAALADGLDHLSRERVGHEIRKLLAAPDPLRAVAAMAKSGVLARVIPGAEPRALGPLIHLRAEADWMVRLAALGGDLDGLRLSRAEAKRIARLRDLAAGTDTAFGLGHKLGEPDAMDALALRAALLEQPMQTEGVTHGATLIFPLQAKDLKPLTGPALGVALDHARRLWLASDGTLDARALIKALDTPEQ